MEGSSGLDGRAPASRFNGGLSSDPSKYEKVPASVRQRFALLQRAAVAALLLFVVLLLAGDSWALRRTKSEKAATHGSRVRGVRVGVLPGTLKGNGDGGEVAVSDEERAAADAEAAEAARRDAAAAWGAVQEDAREGAAGAPAAPAAPVSVADVL